MESQRSRHPADDRFVPRLLGWVRGRREGHAPARAPHHPAVEAGRVRVADPIGASASGSPFDSPLDECDTVLTSARRF